MVGESSALIGFYFILFFGLIFLYRVPSIEHGPTKIQTLLDNNEQYLNHGVTWFKFLYRSYNPEGRKNPVSKEEAMEELIDVVINLN